MAVLALRNDQLHFVMKVAGSLPVEARARLLEHLANTLGHGFTDAELDAALREAAALVKLSVLA